jgi:hypothetical protein
MDFSWLEGSNPVALWWLFLVTASVVNVLAWLAIHRRLTALHQVQPTLWLCAVFVAVCAFRSVLPRADVQRICLFDTWLSTVLVGRSVATVAELCFVAQGAMVLGAVAAAWQVGPARAISRAMVPIIAVAECCSWYAVITTNYAGNMCEESLWAVTYSLAAVALFLLWRRAAGRARTLLAVAGVGCVVYVCFMVRVDVPMYFGRWREDLAAGRAFLGFSDGMHDLATRWVVTRSVEDWRTEFAWMGLYFSCAVWASLAMCLVPLGAGRLAPSRAT